VPRNTGKLLKCARASLPNGGEVENTGVVCTEEIRETEGFSRKDHKNPVKK